MPLEPPPHSDLPHALLGLLTSSSSFDNGLVLLEHLVKRGDVETKTPVNTARREWGSGHPVGSKPTPLLDAMAAVHTAHHYNPSFYRKETAHRLQALDRDAFTWQTSNGEWWIWQNLLGWKDQPDRERCGFGSEADGWAAAVIEKLPDKMFAAAAAQGVWQGLLKMGMPNGARAFAARVPGQWLVRDEKGFPALKTARSAEMWGMALSQGVDPFALSVATDGTARPMWRELLPRVPTSAPEPGSIRAGVEQWLTAQIEADHPQAKTMLAYKVAWLTRWLGPDGDHPKHETDRSWAERMAVVAQQPPRWLEAQTPEAAWLKPFFNRTPGRAERWARAIAKNPEWRRRTGPLNDLVLALFANTNPDQVPGEVWESLAHQSHADTRSQLEALLNGQVWGKTGPHPARTLAAFDAHRLSAALAVPANARPKPRM